MTTQRPDSNMIANGFGTVLPLKARSKTGETSVNLVLWFCYVLGVDLWPKQSLRWSRYPFFLFRIGSSFCLAVTTLGGFVIYSQNLGKAPSTLEVVEVLCFVNSMLTLCTTQFLFFSERYFLKELFCENRRFIDAKLLLLITVNVIYVFLDISDAIQQKSLLAKIVRYASIVAWELQTLFLLLLASCIWIVIGQLEELRLTMGVNRNIQGRKNCIRHNIRKINEIFGTGLFLTHLKVFSLVYLTIMGLLSSRSVWHVLLEVACPFNQVLSLYFIATLGSRVTILCHRASAEFLEGKEFLRVSDPVRTYLSLKHVAVRDDIRILNAFSLHNGSFLTFCGTVLTFIGVLAQFDYKVMSLLDRSKQRFHEAVYLHHEDN